MAEEQKIQYLVRIASTDLDGKKPIGFALTKIKGVGESLASAVCNITGLDKTKKTGILDKSEIELLDKTVRDLTGAGLPTWMANRRKDVETGVDMHIILNELDLTQQNDVKRLSKIKSYRGLRHQWRLPLRGQRTQSNFRKSKRKSASAAKKGRKKGA
jgi:small subunit ribosomal protein S13